MTEKRKNTKKNSQIKNEPHVENEPNIAHFRAEQYRKILEQGQRMIELLLVKLEARIGLKKPPSDADLFLWGAKENAVSLLVDLVSLAAKLVPIEEALMAWEAPPKPKDKKGDAKKAPEETEPELPLLTEEEWQTVEEYVERRKSDAPVADA